MVGIETNVTDFPTGFAPVYNLYTSPAFDKGEGRRALRFYGALVRLRHGSSDLPSFQDDYQHLAGLSPSHGLQSEDAGVTAVERSIHPQAVGWWLFALFVGLAGLVVVGQALSRQSTLESGSYSTLAALGLRPRQVFAHCMLRAGAIGAVGAAGAVVVAFALSPLTPVGEARVAEPSQGFAFDLVVLGLGAIATLAAVVVLSAYPAWRAKRASAQQGHVELFVPRTSAVVAGLARTGAPPSVLVGTSRALERGRGRASVPVFTALLGTVLAVTALVATVVFGASLSNLVSTPALYGMNWQVDLSGLSLAQIEAIAAGSARDRDVTKITSEITSKYVDVNGVTVQSILVQVEKGPMVFSLVEGRYPTARGEIALGATTLAQVGADLGGNVSVAIFNSARSAKSAPLKVVGVVAFPPNSPRAGSAPGRWRRSPTPRTWPAHPVGSGPAACRRLRRSCETTPAGRRRSVPSRARAGAPVPLGWRAGTPRS